MNSSTHKKKAKKPAAARKHQKGGAEAGGIDMRAVYNVSGLISPNFDVVANATRGVDNLIAVPQPFSSGITSQSLSDNTIGVVAPSLGGKYYGGAAKKKSAPAKDLKTSQKKKSEAPKKKAPAAKKK
jgi:hypothetical protein